ncbi:hypothetical protein TBS_12440 [Thermobispora bispora]|jgi:hypothetical protein
MRSGPAASAGYVPAIAGAYGPAPAPPPPIAPPSGAARRARTARGVRMRFAVLSACRGARGGGKAGRAAQSGRPVDERASDRVMGHATGA